MTIASTSPHKLASARDLFALTKPRVMSLVIFTAICGLLAAPGSIHPVIGFTAILAISLGAGASAALNQWYEYDIDAVMKRTANRPLPAGRMDRETALHFGIGLSVFSVLLMGVAVNWLSGAILAFSIFFYAVIYTIWLKRSTPQNIVIGGAAGAFPPVIGWAAVTGDITMMPILLFAVIFFWTPPHFWALALWKRREYTDADVPMLPVTAGPKATRVQIMVYSVLLALSGLALIPTAVGGMVYTVTAVIANAVFCYLAWKVYKRDEETAIAENYVAEKKLFGYSLTYLALIFAALLCDALVRSVGS